MRYVRRVPEDVAHRADLVLADLDGRWEDVYVQPRARLEAVTAAYTGVIPAAGGPCVDLERRDVEFEDFFHVSDGTLEMSRRGDAEGEHAGWSLVLDDRAGGRAGAVRPQTAQRDRAAGHLRRPLDARGVALRPRADLVGVGGEGLLDEEGRPQTVQFASAKEVPQWIKVWEHDPVLERRLLAEYLDRNHAYRTDTADVVRRPASISHGFGSGLRAIGRAADDWAAAATAAPTRLASVIGQLSLERFVEWMGYPALVDHPRTATPGAPTSTGRTSPRSRSSPAARPGAGRARVTASSRRSRAPATQASSTGSPAHALGERRAQR